MTVAFLLHPGREKRPIANSIYSSSSSLLTSRVYYDGGSSFSPPTAAAEGFP